jgi:hypothetical protein
MLHFTEPLSSALHQLPDEAEEEGLHHKESGYFKEDLATAKLDCIQLISKKRREGRKMEWPFCIFINSVFRHSVMESDLERLDSRWSACKRY